MQSKCWLTWLPKEKESHFHRGFYKQEGFEYQRNLLVREKVFIFVSSKVIEYEQRRANRERLA